MILLFAVDARFTEYFCAFVVLSGLNFVFGYKTELSLAQYRKYRVFFVYDRDIAIRTSMQS